jgi:hypothetical protein
MWEIINSGRKIRSQLAGRIGYGWLPLRSLGGLSLSLARSAVLALRFLWINLKRRMSNKLPVHLIYKPSSGVPAIRQTRHIVAELPPNE